MSNSEVSLSSQNDVRMSKRELNRMEVLAQIDDSRLSVDDAANMLDLTRWQVFHKRCADPTHLR